MKVFKHFSFFALALIFTGFAIRSEAASTYVFPAFDVGLLTGGGGPGFTNSLTVTNVPPGEYFAVRVTANYESAPSPNDAFPNTMTMELSDGGTNVYWPASLATVGAIDDDYDGVLAWTGMFPQTSYQGGSNLVIQFLDTDGPYSSTMSNVVITLYPATTPTQTFAAFNVGALTGGGQAFTNWLTATNVPHSEYLFTRVTANYQSSSYPHDAQPDTMAMKMSDGGTNVFWPACGASSGAVASDYTNVIAWSGMFQQSYPGGTNLAIQFMDTNYVSTTSTMSNVLVTLYPAPQPSVTFAPFNVGTLIGGGSAFTNTLNVSGLTNVEYLYARVTANYQSGLQPNAAEPISMEMQLSDGGTNIFWPFSPATEGAIPNYATNMLVWSGMFPQTSYQGGTNLQIQFMDTYDDPFASDISTMSNVVVTLYPAVNTYVAPPLPPQLTIAGLGASVVLAWTNTATGFTLQSATNLIPPVAWSTVSPAPANVNGQFTVTNSVTNSQVFYRLYY